MKKNKYTRLIALLFLLLLFIIMHSFLFGKLFPYSPIALGFTKHELPHTIIYVQNSSSCADYTQLDSLTKSVEKFHRMQFLRKPKIYVFSEKSSYLHRTVTKARFCAYPNGSLVIAPWAIEEAEKGIISLEIYIKHELSHTLLYQHMGIIAAHKYPQWLMEGIAVYSAKQMGTSWYPSKEQVYNTIQNGIFFPPDLYKTNQEDHIKLDIENRIAFMYSEFACIVDYLIASYGEDTFISYVKSLLHGNNHDKTFKAIYKIDFDVCIQHFQSHVANSIIDIREE